jgi:hypothetical protein
MLTAIGGFIIDMSNKLEDISDQQIINKLNIEAHENTAAIWIDHIKEMEKELRKK